MQLSLYASPCGFAMNDKPERLAPIELHRFLSHLTLSSISDEYVGMCVRLAYLCLHARISFYGKPRNGQPIDRLYRILMVSKKEAAAFISDCDVEKLFSVDCGLIQLRPEYDFFDIVTSARKSLATAVKEDVEARDRKRCVYCGATKNLQYDHLYPVSKNGTDTPNNLVLACQPCNSSKSDKTLREWMMS